MEELNSTSKPIKPNYKALAPLIVFLVSYLAVSIIAGDFYKMPITVAFLLASSVGAAMIKGGNLQHKIEVFCQGAANGNVLFMVLIFIMAGAFAQTTKDMGSVDATVNLTLSLLPPALLAPGLFLAACFVSVSVGTSVGTIVALVPVAAGIAAKTGLNPALMTAVIVSGAMFGDNLSFISDTTIAATRTQGCKMSDKFKTNFLIVMPFAVITAVLYYFSANASGLPYDPQKVEWFKVLPYVAVLGAAVSGVNVILVLAGGTILAGLTGILTSSFGIWGWTEAMGKGIVGMGELIIVTLLAGGMLETIRINGGMAWIIEKLTKNIKTKSGAELSIAALVSFANLCTANNTIALLMSGPIAKDIAANFKIPASRTASILDIFSCFVQGLIPYGAQLLMAAALASLTPIEIMKYLYYPILLGLGTLVAIWLGYPQKIRSIFKK
ncbi:Na+/H+ antiporter NhaC family protein [Candidatus Proelusimicrobium excrementi]|uniref:Na+/H+ antiporter NhaC family protein n=1 Tax=Candidatus Proelusimicrobium excrementi TaxID=3416222 RepID=UPI003D10F8E9